MLEQECYEHEDFTGLELDLPELRGKKFVQCDFTGADFSDLHCIVGCTFEGCNLSSVRLCGVEVRNSAFLGCRFRFASFFATTMDGCKMTGSSLTDADLSLLQIVGGDWSWTELRFAELDKRELRDIRFESADLTGAKLTGCTLDGCSFRDAAVSGLSLAGSDLRGADLSGIDLLEVELRGAKVDLAQCILLAEALGAQYTP